MLCIEYYSRKKGLGCKEDWLYHAHTKTIEDKIYNVQVGVHYRGQGSTQDFYFSTGCQGSKTFLIKVFRYHRVIPDGKNRKPSEKRETLCEVLLAGFAIKLELSSVLGLLDSPLAERQLA